MRREYSTFFFFYFSVNWMGGWIRVRIYWINGGFILNLDVGRIKYYVGFIVLFIFYSLGFFSRRIYRYFFRVVVGVLVFFFIKLGFVWGFRIFKGLLNRIFFWSWRKRRRRENGGFVVSSYRLGFYMRSCFFLDGFFSDYFIVSFMFFWELE